MNKGTANKLVALIALLSLGGTAVGGTASGTDDCPVLGELVTQAVLEAGDGLKVRLVPGFPRAGLLKCRQAALTVTVGFSAAMARRNIYVSWQWPDKERGDLCLSADLSQCYPTRNPFVPYSANDGAFVADSWHGVLQAIGPRMPRGYAGDFVRFESGPLAAGLAAELQRSTGGRSQQTYYMD